jgi:penicillin amidase
MLTNKILRAVNYLLLAVVTVALAGAGWWVWRPTAETSGRLEAPVGAELRLLRDKLGVAHVEATNTEDALFAQGFATAQDRFWQMDSLRRLAGGELSEVVGAAALEMDKRSRKLRMRRLAEAWRQHLPARDRAYLAAYVRGVNFYLETHGSKLPPEFTLLGYHPRAWSVTDSLLCSLQMMRTLSGNWENDLAKAQMLRAGDKEKVEFLFPVRSGDEPLPGSNAWAVSGAHSTTGKPILANDPHLEWTMPSTWYAIHLKAPGLDVAGATLPGVPGVVVGHNQRIAWGITALEFDNMDLYAEKLDPRTGRYEYQGRILEAAREAEWIAVKGAPAVEVLNLVTVHGPIFASDEGTQLAIKWTSAVPDDFSFPMVDLNRANNWTEFRQVLSHMSGPNINVMYADVDGNIGWQTAGRIPLRRGFAGDVPLDGASGRQEWDGFVPFDQMPSYFNPPSGVLASANQNCFSEKTPYTVSGHFASPHRSRQIVARLASRPRWKPAEMMIVQRDNYSLFLANISREAVRAVERRAEKNPLAIEGARLLRAWDGQARASEAAPLLATLLYQHLRRTVSDRAVPKQGFEKRGNMPPAVVEKILRERPAGWFDDYDLVLVTALSDAMEEAQRMQGRNSAKWQYGRINTLTIAHPIFSRLSWLAPYFNVGPVEIDGTGTSINATSTRSGPSMRFIADLSRWDGSSLNLTVGQSGHILSGHYKDQWKAYRGGVPLPLQYTHVDAASTLVLAPR